MVGTSSAFSLLLAATIQTGRQHSPEGMCSQVWWPAFVLATWETDPGISWFCQPVELAFLGPQDHSKRRSGFQTGTGTMSTYGNTASPQDQGRGSRQNGQFCFPMDRLNCILSQLPAAEVLTVILPFRTLMILAHPQLLGAAEQRWWLGQSQRFVRQPRASPTQD